MTRTFVTAGVKKLCGSKFHSATPSQAAAKVFNVLCSGHKACHKVIKVVDVEKDKVYKYRVERLRQNKTVLINGKPILFRFSTKVQSLKK
jgi:hypothetical protein